MKRLVAILVFALLAIPVSAVAGADKFSFNDVTFPDGTIGELEASSKAKKDSGYTTCSYFSDDYRSYRGYFESPEFVEAGAVLQFCLDHFNDREVH